VIFNIGARDFDFMDPEEFVREARAQGITVISNLRNTSGSFIAPPLTTLRAGEERLIVAGLAWPNLNAYRQDVRPELAPYDPLLWLTSSGVLFAAAGYPFVLSSHAGVGRDRQMLRAVPRRTLVVGGQQRLVFRGRQGLHGSVYMQNGAYGERVNVTRVSFAGGGVRTAFEDYLIDADTPQDRELQTFIDQVKEARLRSEDLIIVGTMDRDYSVAEAARWAVEALREVADADVAVLDKNHFGAGLPGGPLTKYRFDMFLPFDSQLVSATVDAVMLEHVLLRANLSASTPLEELRADFIYASDISPEGGERYTLVTSERVAQSAEWLLGTTEIDFHPVPEATVKALLAEALDRKLR
jgi:5'-nucleotidase / UDP-sugar diphosphatase